METSVTEVTEETTVIETTAETSAETSAPDVVSGAESPAESEAESEMVCLLLREQNDLLLEMNERSVRTSGMIEIVCISLILFLVFKAAFGILDIFKP